MFSFVLSLVNATRAAGWAVLAILCCLYSTALMAEQVTLAWDPSTGGDVGGYRLHYGPNSGDYTSNIDVGTQTSYTVTGLSAGTTYYFAVSAYDSANTTESSYSNEVSTTTAAAAPVANFSATPTSGTAPLAVSFTDTSTGNITNRTWTFGDGSNGSGQTALKSYTNPGTYTVSLTVTGPGGSDTITKTGLVSVTAAAPVANFSASTTSGSAPMTVNFNDTSGGNITSRSWNFGDGSTSTTQNPSHTYDAAGTYTVALTVTGPGGSNTKTRTDYITVSAPGGGTPGAALLETGEITVDDQWQRITFTRSFIDPVVVATPMGLNDAEPAVIRIRNVDATGFDIRLQEWDYLDGIHALETVGYLVMERGSHTLENGTKVEAGRFDTNNTSSFKTAMFAQSFSTKPVMLAAVTSFNGIDAVATRLRNISVTDFQLQMQTQEANGGGHVTETVSYIAWEPSMGTVDGVAF